VETVEAGWNQLVGTHTRAIVDAFHVANATRKRSIPPLYGDGKASEYIVNLLKEAFRHR
jgi:UDP-N-acetylglucosamine 2-epimerase